MGVFIIFYNLSWHQLYEQQKKATSKEIAFMLDWYVNRW
jgi:hypothetical protein